MQDLITAIFCTLMIAAGWFYLARSQGVARLQGYESPRRNTTRRKARRMGAWAMIITGSGWFWLMWELGHKTSPLRVVLALLVVSVALLTMILCAFVDMYLTARLRRSNQNFKP